MGKIRILSEEVVAKISAGEIIDAPYSVVRELMDNSIDASGTRIVVNVVEGGKKLIEVIDDGEGMDREDIEKCYLRHSTSKIWSVEDIYRVTTMGFRGEALGSIAEVSELEIISKRAEQEEGYKLNVRGGRMVSLLPYPSPNGTTVRVKNLFFNLPPRRNFLKSETVEFRSVLDTFIKKAIPFPEIHFELLHNSRMELLLPRVSSVIDRIKSVYPDIRELNHNRKELEGIKVEVFFSKPSVNRPTRNLQQLFVNRRFVESRTFLNAVSQAYSNLVPKGNFPIVFCFITVDPSMVDVNIHPAKKEVKFRNEGKVFHIVVEAIREGLAKTEQVLSIEDIDTKFSRFEIEIKKSIESFLVGRKEDLQEKAKERAKSSSEAMSQTLSTLSQDSKLSISSGSEVKESAQRVIGSRTEGRLNLRFLGTVFQTYLIFEDIYNQRLLLVDYHAVHERIIFSTLYREVSRGKPLAKQLLLVPVEVELSVELASVLREKIEVFDRLGFSVEISGRKAVISSVPSIFGKGMDAEAGVLEVCEKIISGMEVNVENILKVFSSISCRSAIKSGDNITPSEAYELVERAFDMEEGFVCPHGRPSMMYIDKKTLDSMFSR